MVERLTVATRGEGLHEVTGQAKQSRLCLGPWPGIYLGEHRRRGGERELVVHVGA